MRSQKWFLLTAAVLVLLLVGSRLTLSAGDKDNKMGKKVEIDLLYAVQAGDKVLKPGTYEIQCEMKNQGHEMLFTNPRTGKIAASVPCECQTVEKPNPSTEVRLQKSESSEVRILKEIRIQGEAIIHRFHVIDTEPHP